MDKVDAVVYNFSVVSLHRASNIVGKTSNIDRGERSHLPSSATIRAIALYLTLFEGTSNILGKTSHICAKSDRISPLGATIRAITFVRDFAAREYLH